MEAKRHFFINAAMIVLLSATSICGFGQVDGYRADGTLYHPGFPSLYAALHANTMLQNGDRFVITQDLIETEAVIIENGDPNITFSIRDNYVFTFESAPGTTHTVRIPNTGGGNFRIGNTGRPDKGKGYNVTFKNIEFIGNEVTDFTAWDTPIPGGTYSANHSNHMFSVNYSTVSFNGCKMHGNKLNGSYTNGTVLSSDNCNVSFDKDCEIYDCWAINSGDDSNSGVRAYGHGAISMCRNSTLNFNGYIHNCYAHNGGGAIVSYADASAYVTLNIQGNAKIEDCGSTTNCTYGGAIMMTNPNDRCTINNGVSIKYCYASFFGGAIYLTNNAQLTINGGTIDGCTAQFNGGAIHNSGGTVTISGGVIQSCSATNANGGAIYNMSNSNIAITSGTIQDCSASQAGGAIFNQGIITVSGGTISNASAGTFGKGIYQDGTMYLSGNPSYGTNDVYLPCTKTSDAGSGTNRVITKNGNITVSASSIHVWLGSASNNLYTGRNYFETGNAAVVEGDLNLFTIDNQSDLDTKALIKRFAANDATTHKAVLEIFNPTWVGAVTSQPSGFDVSNIDSKEDLAWFISYVNGYNGSQSHLNANGILTADVDMSEYDWVPIGNEEAYKGIFNGNGYTIKGLNNTQYPNIVMPGMFNQVSGTVKNTFVVTSDFNTYNYVGYFGIIANTLSGTAATVHDSEAAGTLEAGSANAHIGGLVGHLTNTSTVHSCISVAGLNGYEMGGMVCKLESGTSLKNGYSNNTFMSKANDYYVGALAAVNAGSIENCYLLNRATNGINALTGAKKGAFTGNNTGSVNYCYYPYAISGIILNGSGSGSCTNDDTFTTTTTPYGYKHNDNYLTGSNNSMLAALNAHRGSGTTWMRTTAGSHNSHGTAANLNEDYPVLKIADFEAFASHDGIVLHYGRINHLLAEFTTSGDAIDLYQNITAVNGNTSSDAILYINEDVALTQNGGLRAYTCQTMTKPSTGDYWHLIASSLTQSPVGFLYGIESQVGWIDDNPSAVNNPCNISIITDDEASLFPTNTPIGSLDLYCFYEPQYHWLNLKRNKLSHWHMDDHTQNIAYNGADNQANSGSLNNSYLIPGKGYLAAIDDPTLLQSYGTLNNGNVTIAVTAQANNELKGYNLLGNPYQSYLDFDKFATANRSMWSSGSKFANSYVIYDAAENAYVGYLSNPSSGSMAATGKINMHQGFFIVADNSTNATFNNEMRSIEADGASFRGERPAFPLINLKATSADGTGDIAVVEFGRPEFEGAAKMKNIGGNGKVYFRYGDEDYAVLYMDREVEQLPLYFETTENATYTLTWNTANATFNQLHLIDNLTGLDIDMLSSEGYSFTAKPDDYKSRFRLVFEYNGIDEDSYVEPAETFAFFSNGNLIVNGEGLLEVIDMQGRVLISSRLTDTQNTRSLPNAAQGIYMLKLTSNNNVRIQKIIVR